MDKVAAFKRSLTGQNSGLDQATRDAIVRSALKAIGVKNPVIPGRTGNA